jgi:hypothetical protein
MKKPVTGKYSIKPYRCTQCGNESEIGTNHWGFVYSRCRICGNTEHECLELVPEGYGIPEKWKKVKLGDLVEIRRGIPLPK